MDGTCGGEAGEAAEGFEDDVAGGELAGAAAVGAVVAAVAFDAAAIGVDGVEIVGFLEEDAAIAEDVAGYAVAGSVGELEGVAAIQCDGEELKTGGCAAGVDDAVGGQVEGSDGVVLGADDTARGAAGYGDLPDLPRVGRLGFGGEENVPAVEGNGGIGGGGKVRGEGSLAAGGD